MLRFPYQQIQPQRVPAFSIPQPSLLWRVVRLLTGKRSAEPESVSRKDDPVSDSAARPFVSVRIQGPVAARRLRYALLDTESQDTLFPIELAEPLGIVLGGKKQALKWRGQRYWVEFHPVELELTQSGTHCRWRARAGFTPAPLSYALLGQRGCLEFLDATFRGADHVAELEINRLFPGTARSET
jgi:hypothetical protein